MYSDADAPAFDKSTMDGYAVRAADTQVGARLRVAQTIAAGEVGDVALQRGEAAAIMTGAPVPPGADAVVPVEWTTEQGDQVVLRRAARAGDSVARRGSDIAGGAIVLPTGSRLTPAAIAVAASVGAARPLVFARPAVAVLSTGDELVGIDQTPTGAQIRNSNSPMLVAQLERMGCDVQNHGIVRDDRSATRSAMERALAADAVFITGGMSMGQRDYVPELMHELGLHVQIRKLRIKPGKPFAFATGRSLVFGLPGNPVSAFVCTVRLAGRVLSRMGGGAAEATVSQAVLEGDLAANGPREFYQPALLSGGCVRPLPWKGSADIYTLARADALVIRPENAAAAAAGELVPVLPLP